MRVAVRLGIVAALVLGFAAGAMAQNPPSQPAQQGQPGRVAVPAQQGQTGAPGAMQGRGMRQGMQNPDRMAMRAQIEERFGQRIQAELGLNDQQMERLRTAGRANEDRQRETSRREGDLFRAVVEQLRPGVAANQDSLGRMLDGIAAKIAARPQWQATRLAPVTAKGGSAAVALEVRFISAADEIALRDFVIANATGPNTPNAGSWLTIHDCSHDDPNPTPDVVAFRQDW